MRLKLFISSGLTTESEKNNNVATAEYLQGVADIYLPQRDGGLLVDYLEKGESWGDASKRIFSNDLNALKNCDIVIAHLPAGPVGGGVCFELGMAFALGKQCWGLVAANSTRPKSPLIENGISRQFNDLREIYIEIKRLSC
jgi:nucleoside 2-deoxyribosyltransferase